jgi:hypothetical protein
MESGRCSLGIDFIERMHKTVIGSAEKLTEIVALLK